jgi:hypothetical protein
MRAPMPTPEGLPARAAIIIMGCLFVFLSALSLFVITKAMIAIGVGAVALFSGQTILNSRPWDMSRTSTSADS